MGTEVLAECEDDAIENAKEELLSNNWYYVHDSIDEWSIEFLWDPTAYIKEICYIGENTSIA